MRGISGVGIATLAVLACTTMPDAPNVGPPGIRVLSGGDQVDTVQSILGIPLIVETRDSAGRPRVGAHVAFTGFTAHGGGSEVGSDPLGGFVTALATITDARGRAQAFVRLDTLAGSTHITAATIDSFGFRLDSVTASFVVEPGHPARVTIQVSDSTAYVGGGYQLGARVADRFANPRTEPVTYESLGPTIALVGTAGHVTAQAIGRAGIVAAGAGFADTAWMTVPPKGMLAAIDLGDAASGLQPGLVLVQLDGSGYRRIAPAGELPEWNVQGDSILYGRNGRLHVVDTLGAFDRLLVPTGPTTGEAWGSYSGDGAWVFFNDANSCQPLYRARSDGTQAVGIGPAACDSIAIRPSSSPDGTRAAVWHPVYGVGIVEVASGAITYVIPNCLCPFTNYPARWSPDGTTLAYAKDTVIFLTTPQGATPTQLTSPSVASYDPLAFRWSPDSRWLVARRRNGVDLIRVQDGLRLPIGWSPRLLDPAWRP